MLQAYFLFAESENAGEANLKLFVNFLSQNKSHFDSTIQNTVELFLAEAEYKSNREEKIAQLFTQLNENEVLPLVAEWQPGDEALLLGKEGTFSLWYFGNGVFLIDNESDPLYEYVESTQLPALIPDFCKNYLRVVVFSRKIPEQEPWSLPAELRTESYSSEPKTRAGKELYEVKVRVAVTDDSVSLFSLPDLDLFETRARQNSQDLQWSFGGRAEAGSTFRDGGSHQSGEAFARALSGSLVG